MNNYTEMENARIRIEASIKIIEQEIRRLPQGHLQCYRNGENFKWFIVNQTESEPLENDDEERERVSRAKKITRKYIPRSYEDLAQSLAYKGYLQAQLRAYREENKAIKKYLRNCNVKDYAENYLSRTPEHRRLVNDARNKNMSAKDAELRNWLSDQNPSTAPNQDKRTLMSQAGYLVRSKSEQIIVALLIRYNIPFKYEQCIYASGTAIYPDFLIMHPETHKIFIWEHLGMMDDDKYRKHNLWKIGEYAKTGFVPGDNLILTYETKSSGCDEMLAEYLIRHYLT